MCLFPGSLFCSTDPCVCFSASTILFCFWVLLVFSFHRGGIRQAGLLLGLATPFWGPHRGCFSQVKSESWHHRCQGLCHFLSSVSLQQQLEAMDRPVLQFLDGPVLQLRIIAQFYLESKGKYILEV